MKIKEFITKYSMGEYVAEVQPIAVKHFGDTANADDMTNLVRLLDEYDFDF